MKKLMTLLSLLIIDLISFGQGSSYSRYTDVIPAAGHTVTFHACCSYPPLCQVISVNTAGSAVNLGGNTYTLTYDSLPDKFQWDVYCDFHQLTFNNANQVTIFGVQPLVNWPAADTFTIHFVVLLNGGSKALWYNYVSQQVQISGTIPGNVTFNGIVTLADSAMYPGAPLVSGTPDRGKILGISPTSGSISRYCALLCSDSGDFWNIHGNLGLGGLKRFLGTTDSAFLNFRSNNMACGSIGVNSTTTTYGYQAGQAITSISGNTVIGYQADLVATSANNNTYVGSQAGVVNSSGSSNTGIGQNSLNTVTTGGSNTALGVASGVTSATVSNSTAIGANATAGISGIAIGSAATASASQCTLNGVRALNMPNMISAVGYVLTDSTGSGNFIPKAAPGNDIVPFTPISGDSINISAAKNPINPAGTIANLTIVLPASIIGGQVYEFSFLQAVTTVHYSIRFSGGTVSAGVPTAAAQYATIKIYYSPTLSQWILY